METTMTLERYKFMKKDNNISKSEKKNRKYR